MVDFLSRLVMSLAGFVATIVLTRTLGRSDYGTYVIVLSVLAWMTIASQAGLRQAILKRISESNEGNYVVSGAISQLVLYTAVATILWIGRPYLNSFMGVEATWVLILMLGVRLGLEFVRTVLEGQHMVHLSSLLSPAEWIGRSSLQIILVLSGFGIAGAFAGYIAGAIFATAIGILYISLPRTSPSVRDFSRLKAFARYSWLGSIKGRTFQSMDTIILAFFVSNSLIAVYEVAWNLASVLAIFGFSITRTLFPEMSKIASMEESKSEISNLLQLSLSYSGLFIIPGIVGSALVGDIVLTIYGSGFSTGYQILMMLTFAQLLYVYMRQFESTIDAVDRPDLTFGINLVFVATNLLLNILLTWRYGWYGAAIATITSAGVGLLISYYYASNVVLVSVPFIEIAKQWFAALSMAVVVVLGRFLFGEELTTIVILVVVGATVYFSILLTISIEFRATVKANSPI